MHAAGAGELVGPFGADQRTHSVTILFDETCPFCVRCAVWLASQRCLVPVELLAAHSPAAARRFGSLPFLGEELYVVDDQAQMWSGPAAFLMCLWVTKRYRVMACRFSRPSMIGSAEAFFLAVSKNRARLGGRPVGDVGSGGDARGGDECERCHA